MVASDFRDSKPAALIAPRKPSGVPADREMQRVLRTEPIEFFNVNDAFDTKLAHWKHDPIHEVVLPMSDHVVMTYLGPMQRLERRSERKYSSGMGRRGSITFIPAGSSSHWDIYGPMEIVQLYLSPELLDEVAQECPGPTKSLVESTVRSDKTTSMLLEMMLRSSGDPAYLGALYRQQSASLIAVQIVKTHSEHTMMTSKASGGLSPKVLRMSLERLSSENEDDFSLGALAGAANLSRFHFCRAFKRSTGLTPHEWLRQRRMEQAMSMLRNLSMSITDIAGVLGYATLTAFSTAFKRHTGQTPGEWRRTAI